MTCIYPQCCSSGDWTTNSTFSIHSLPQEHQLLVVAEAADSQLLLLTSLKLPWNQLLVFVCHATAVTSALKTFSSHKPFLKFRCPCVCKRNCKLSLGANRYQLRLTPVRRRAKCPFFIFFFLLNMRQAKWMPFCCRKVVKFSWRHSGSHGMGLKTNYNPPPPKKQKQKIQKTKQKHSDYTQFCKLQYKRDFGIYGHFY